MKYPIRFLSILLAFLLLASVVTLASCTEKMEVDGETTVSTADGTTEGGDNAEDPDLTTDGNDDSSEDANITSAEITTDGNAGEDPDVTTNEETSTEPDATTDEEIKAEPDATTGEEIPAEPLPDLGSGIGDLAYTKDLSFIDRSGYVNIESLRGKVVVLNFWGTWCPPCREELLNEFPSIYDAYGNDVIVLTVHSVYNYNESAVSSFLSEGNITDIPTFLFAVDSGDEAYYEQLGGTGYWPYTLVLDTNGVIAEKFVGAVLFQRDLKPVIDSALGS